MKLIKFIQKNINLIVKILYFIIAIIITVSLFPRKEKFSFEIRKGTPWKHENLIAKYNFPIYKSEKELNFEKDSILSNYFPYYDYNNDVSSKNISSFKKYLEKYSLKKLQSDSVAFKDKRKFKKYKDSLSVFIINTENLVKNIYSKGIIELNEFSNIGDTAGFSIMITKNGISEKLNINEIYTGKKAYEKVKKFINSFSYDTINLSKINFENFLQPNLSYNKNISDKIKKQMLNNISPVRGMIQAGELIIYKGELVDENKYQILTSLKKEFEASSGALASKKIVLLGQIILLLSIFGILFFYLYYFHNDIIKSNLKTLYFLSVMLLFIVVSILFVKYNFLDIYIVPVVILPIMTMTFHNMRLAILHHTTTILIIGFIAPNGFEYVFIQFIAGAGAIFGISKLHNRGQIIQTAILVSIIYIFVYSGITVTYEGEISKINFLKFGWFLVSALLVLLSYPLIYIFEKVFGFISDVTLLELSNTNQPLLRTLAEKAPGTFQHSVQVGNLAEEAVRQVGGNPLLVRTAALYHDIGKTANPHYFTENQIGGFNPHSELEPEESAKIIINHIIEGEAIAKRNNLPKDIISFIKSHHGTGKVRWFLHSFKTKYPNKKLNESIFAYPGFTPKTKEQAILMMADVVEATSRSLTEVNEKSISDLVNKLIDYQISEKHFDNADITFAEISQVKEVFKKKLQNIYHSRIKYPSLEEKPIK